jgi:hypothetical protein
MKTYWGSGGIAPRIDLGTRIYSSLSMWGIILSESLVMETGKLYLRKFPVDEVL